MKFKLLNLYLKRFEAYLKIVFISTLFASAFYGYQSYAQNGSIILEAHIDYRDSSNNVYQEKSNQIILKRSILSIALEGGENAMTIPGGSVRFQYTLYNNGNTPVSIHFNQEILNNSNFADIQYHLDGKRYQNTYFYFNSGEEKKIEIEIKTNDNISPQTIQLGKIASYQASQGNLKYSDYDPTQWKSVTSPHTITIMQPRINYLTTDLIYIGEQADQPNSPDDLNQPNQNANPLLAPDYSPANVLTINDNTQKIFYLRLENDTNYEKEYNISILLPSTGWKIKIRTNNDNIIVFDNHNYQANFSISVPPKSEENNNFALLKVELTPEEVSLKNPAWTLRPAFSYLSIEDTNQNSRFEQPILFQIYGIEEGLVEDQLLLHVEQDREIQNITVKSDRSSNFNTLSGKEEQITYIVENEGNTGEFLTVLYQTDTQYINIIKNEIYRNNKLQNSKTLIDRFFPGDQANIIRSLKTTPYTEEQINKRSNIGVSLESINNALSARTSTITIVKPEIEVKQSLSKLENCSINSKKTVLNNLDSVSANECLLVEIDYKDVTEHEFKPESVQYHFPLHNELEFTQFITEKYLENDHFKLTNEGVFVNLFDIKEQKEGKLQFILKVRENTSNLDY